MSRHACCECDAITAPGQTLCLRCMAEHYDDAEDDA